MRISAVLALFALVAACGGTNITELSGPDTVRCELALGATTATVPAAGSQVSVALTTERECTWTARSDTSWIGVSPTSGQGDAAVTVTVQANSSQTNRSGSITINTLQFQVTQIGVSPPPPPACVYTLSPVERTINDNGGTRTVRVTTAQNCQWAATSSVTWISILSSRNGTGTTDISYRVDRNNSSNDRVGVITIADRTHTVRQSGD